MYNAKRLGKFILRGNPGKIFFPNEREGKNNLQRIVTFSRRLLNDTLKAALNKTTTEVIELAKNVPKDTAKNLICLTPNIVLKMRQMLSEKDQNSIERQFSQDIRLHSCKYLSGNTCFILQNISQKLSHFKAKIIIKAHQQAL